MYNMLRDAGYYVETLGSPFTCFEVSRYGTLLMVDLEDDYFEEEIRKLRDDVVNGGLGLAVFAEWYNVDSMVKMKFFDDNTRSWWTPVTGGANVPALNELLAPLGIAFGDKILSGDFSINGEHSHYASGTDIVKFPGGGYVHSFQFQDNSESATQNILQNTGMTKLSSILGLVEVGRGRIAVYGDSNCLDSSHMVTNCYWLLRKILDFTNSNTKDPVLFSEAAKIQNPIYEEDGRLPSRRTDVNFSTYSAVVAKDLICHHDSRFEVWGTKGYGIQLVGRNRKLPGYPSMELVSNFSTTTEASDLRLDEATIQMPDGNSIAVTGSKFGNTMNFLDLLNHDEVDIPMMVAGQWIVPLFVAATCLALFLSWRVLQKRRRQRKGSVSARLTNLV